MGIEFDTATSIFSLETARTSYRMRVDERGHLLHLYYGRSIGQDDLSALYPPADHGFSPDYYPCRRERGVSPDVLPQEYTGCNVGDFRLSCVVVRNEYYWGGEVPLDRVTLLCVDDQTTRSMALQTGEIDIAYNLKTENVAEFEGNPDIQIQQLESLRSTYAFMNQNGPLGDIKLRQALIRGLDRETYCASLLDGGATPGKAPVPPTLDFGFDELTDENAYDPEGAKALLAEAGYQDVDGDGYVETPSGEPLDLEFVIYTSREELGVYAQAAQASLKDIGIRVTLNTVSYETLLDMRDAGQFDLLIWNVLVANTGDPEKYLRENWYSTSPSNQAGYNNPEVDALLDQLATEFDEAARRELVIQIQQHIMDDAATVFFGYETTYLFSNSRVTGVTMYPMDYYWLTQGIKLA